MADYLEIDGSEGEGGGQIVRTALALSTVLKKPFRIRNIRQGRQVPGLKHQHMHAIKALETLCGAKTEGAEVGSEELSFEPGELKPQTLSIDIETAGSITLLLQSLLVPTILGGGKFRLRIKGGTDVKWSMPSDYLKELLLPHLKKYAEIDYKLENRGYYPKGQGRIDLKVRGKFTPANREESPKITLVEQGQLIHIKGTSHASKELEKAQVADRQTKAAKLSLAKLDCPLNISSEYCQTASTGSGITLWAIFSKDGDEIDFKDPVRLGADSLGERGKRAETVGQEAADRLLKEIRSGAAVDSRLADNLIPFIALFGGSIRVSDITSHTRTNILVCEKFLGKCIEVDEENKVISSAGTREDVVEERVD